MCQKVPLEEFSGESSRCFWFPSSACSFRTDGRERSREKSPRGEGHQQSCAPDPSSWSLLLTPIGMSDFFPLWAQLPRFLFKDLTKWKLQKFSVNSNVYIKARRWYFNISLILSIPISFLHFNVSELSYAINLMCICSVTAFIFAPKSLTKLVLLLTTHNILQPKK